MSRSKKRPNPFGDATLVTAAEVAVFFGVSPKHIRRLAEKGSIPKPRRLGGILRWTKQEIEDFAKG